jgi:hypothetical protein
MSDVELLRKAAAKMRELAEAAQGRTKRWHLDDGNPWLTVPQLQPLGHPVTESVDPEVIFPHHAEHIAAWDPTVALAVADWLEDEAKTLEIHLGVSARLQASTAGFAKVYAKPLATARAFLREDS